MILYYIFFFSKFYGKVNCHTWLCLHEKLNLGFVHSFLWWKPPTKQLILSVKNNYFSTLNCFFRFIVDNVWVHDKDLPAIKTEQGHYNNSIRIKKSSEDIMLIKNPREDNLIGKKLICFKRIPWNQHILCWFHEIKNII